MNDGTAASLITYLDLVVDKGRATIGAVGPLKTAFMKVLEAVDEGDWKKTSVKDIDVDDYIHRFGNKTSGTYTSKSISIYKTRMTRAISWYLKFLDEPGWMPQVKARVPGSEPVRRAAEPSTPAAPVQHASPNSLTYPFPMGNGEVATVTLPLGLRQSDADRFTAFVQSLVIDEV